MTINIKGYEVLIDDEDYERIVNIGSWHTHKKQSGKVYFVNDAGHKKRKIIRLHRFITNCPKGVYVDHINGNTLDNRKCNLRICSIAENARNRGKTKRNTSGYKGVQFVRCRNKYTAQIRVNYKLIFLGYFNSPEAAHTAYCEAAKKYHGEFAKAV